MKASVVKTCVTRILYPASCIQHVLARACVAAFVRQVQRVVSTRLTGAANAACGGACARGESISCTAPFCSVDTSNKTGNASFRVASSLRPHAHLYALDKYVCVCARACVRVFVPVCAPMRACSRVRPSRESSRSSDGCSRDRIPWARTIWRTSVD
jgi:hypothetical protein